MLWADYFRLMGYEGIIWCCGRAKKQKRQDSETLPFENTLLFFLVS